MGRATGQTMIPVVLDTDPGVDDAMALAYALCHPAIDLKALTITFGNVNVLQAARNARFLLERFGASEVTVALGCAAPLVQSAYPFPDFVHGRDGLGNRYPDELVELAPGESPPASDAEDAADLIVRLAREMPGEIVLVAVGPLGNIATALAREPELPSLVKRLVVMGGSLHEPGNVSPLAEANFVNDPHAADQVFAADWPATVVGLDVTHRVLLSDADLARLRDRAGRTGELLWDISRFYVEHYSTRGAARGGDEPACAMHDAAAIAEVLMPDAFEKLTGGARVVDTGIAAGLFTLDVRGGDYLLPYWAERPRSVSACVSVDAERVRGDFLDTLIAHHRA